VIDDLRHLVDVDEDRYPDDTVAAIGLHPVATAFDDGRLERLDVDGVARPHVQRVAVPADLGVGDVGASDDRDETADEDQEP
jgi:hypothetical protein